MSKVYADKQVQLSKIFLTKCKNKNRICIF